MEKKVANTLLEKEIKVSITETKKRLFRPTQKTHDFYLKPPTLGTLIAIGSEIQELNPKVLKGEASLYDITNWIHETMFKNGDSIVNILAIALTNNNPTTKVKKLIKENTTPKELQDIFSIYLTQINVQDFINSIVLIKNSDIIKTSPEDQRS